MYPGANLVPEVVTYKHTPQGELRVHLFAPPADGEITCAIVFFVCGGWKGFDAEFRYPQARYYASRGAVTGVAEVRVIPVHGTTPTECVVDGKSAVRWMRNVSCERGGASDRVVAAGGSAAGHVSMCTAMLPGYDEPGEDTSVSSAPNLICAYNPAVLPFIKPAGPHTEGEELRIGRFGSAEKAWELSPTRLVRPGLPPMIIMQGDKDEVTPIGPCREFVAAMKTAGNECELVVYPGEGHGFMNYRPEGNPRFDETLGEMDRFLVRHGFLAGNTSITPHCV